VIRRLSTDADLYALAPHWAALWRASPSTPFAHPAWLLPWWRQFGTGRPRVAVSGTGVLPMYELDGRLLPLGAGTTDHCDLLGTGADTLLAALLDDRPAELLAVPPGSPLRDVAVQPGWTIRWQAADSCPALVLPRSMDALLAAVPHTARKLRMNRNRAARAGTVAIRTATAETLADDLATLIRLHQSRWVPQGEPGAAIYALLSAGCIHFYLSGFDAAHTAISPGSLLLAAMLEQAIGEGRHEADFLRGRESYKYAWGAQDRWSAQALIRPAADV